MKTTEFKGDMTWSFLICSLKYTYIMHKQIYKQKNYFFNLHSDPLFEMINF